MVTCSELRARARASLRGLFDVRWLMVIVANVVISAILGAGSFFFVLPLIIGGPLVVGLAGYVLAMVRDHENTPDFGRVFSGFDNFGKNLATYLLMMVYLALWSMLFIIPGIVKAMAYAMTNYIRNDHPEYSADQAITESCRMMNGHKMKYFLLQLSFIGWMIVGYLCCGVGTLWVKAYMSAANAHFYEELKRQEMPQNQEIPSFPM